MMPFITSKAEGGTGTHGELYSQDPHQGIYLTLTCLVSAPDAFRPYLDLFLTCPPPAMEDIASMQASLPQLCPSLALLPKSAVIFQNGVTTLPEACLHSYFSVAQQLSQGWEIPGDV